MARIAGINIPPQQHAEIGLTAIYGIGRSRAREILTNCGIEFSKKVKDLTTDGRRHATSSKQTADAMLRSGTTITVLETKLLSTGNLWVRCPSGWLCIWEKDIDRKFIK